MPSVITDPATDVTDSSATINGRVTDLGDAEAVDLRFEYREVDSDSWSATEDQQVTAETSCSETVENLAVETEYEYRVVASSDVGTETGETRSFVTDAVEIGEPVIESLRAGIQADRTRASTLRWSGASPTPTAPSRKYGSSSERSGQAGRRPTVDVDGSSAVGTEEFRIKHGSGEPYVVTLTVNDRAGDVTEEETTIST